MHEEYNSIALIITLGIFGILFGSYSIVCVYGIIPTPIDEPVMKESEEEKKKRNSLIREDENASLISQNQQEKENQEKNIVLTQKQIDRMIFISDLISSGANVFLAWEYLCLLIFVLVLSVLISLSAEHKLGQFYTTIAFITGSLTSILCGFIGMKVATASNYRTAYKAQ